MIVDSIEEPQGAQRLTSFQALDAQQKLARVPTEKYLAISSIISFGNIKD